MRAVLNMLCLRKGGDEFAALRLAWRQIPTSDATSVERTEGDKPPPYGSISLHQHHSPGLGEIAGGEFIK